MDQQPTNSVHAIVTDPPYGLKEYTTPEKQKLVIKGMGFTRLNQVIERPDNAAIRGMVKKVPHLVEIVK